MKSFIFIISFVLTFSAHANWFQARGNLRVNPKQIDVTIQNRFGSPVRCEARIQAYNNLGQSAYFRLVIEPFGAGKQGYAFARATGYSYFVRAHAEIYCQNVYSYGARAICEQNYYHACVRQCGQTGRFFSYCQSQCLSPYQVAQRRRACF